MMRTKKWNLLHKGHLDAASWNLWNIGRVDVSMKAKIPGNVGARYKHVKIP